MIRTTSFKKWTLAVQTAIESITPVRFIRVRSLRSSYRKKVLAIEGLESRDLFAVGDLRMVSYNVLGGSGTTRSGLGTILQGIGAEVVNGNSRPIDVLAIQEVNTQASTTASVVNQLNAIYGAGVYARGSLNGSSTSGNDTVGLVYNTQTVQLVAETAIGSPSGSGQPRQALRYQLRPIGLPAGNDFYVYNSHYKASDTSEDRGRRLVEAQAIRANADALPQGTNIVYMGDFNMYTSSEPAYQALLAAGNGQAQDPINRPGSWHNNSSFTSIFTQAPAVTPPSGFTGGGLDDRFDFQLLSGEWFDSQGLDYRTGTYHTFGNNGSVAMNGDINAASSTALPGLANRLQLLDLLTTVSDHLPVVADYFFNGNVNNAPTDVGISPSAIVENAAANSLVGTFSSVDPNAGDTFTYSLVGGVGSTDNALFSIVGNQLRTNQVFNYETQNVYTIRVRSTDQGGLSFEKSMTIGVIDVNESPTDVTLSSQSIAENLAPNSVVGMLNAVDPDASNTFTYELVDGDGASDNSSFVISGSQLQSAASFDFETKSSYAIRVRATDQGGLSVEKTFTVNVSDSNDPPTAIIFAPTSVNQYQSFQPQGFADDQDVGQTYQYEWDFNYDGVNFDVDATGDTPTYAYTTSGNFVIALRVTDSGSPTLSSIETASIVVNPMANTAPTISTIANQTTPLNTSTGPISFTVGDAQSFPDDLFVFASTSNSTLIPFSNIVLDGSGSNRTVTITPASGQTGTATITLSVTDGDLTTSTSFNVTVGSPNTAPTITSVANQTVQANTSTGALAFTVGDAQTAAASLTVTRTSSNTTLVPLANVVLGGSGANRTVTVTPVSGQSGNTTITLTVSDGSLTTSTQFTVTVNPNTAPTITSIANQTIEANTSTPALGFTVGDAQTAAGSLTVVAASSDTTLFPVANIVLTGTGANRSVTVTPANGQSGTATITLTVSDGFLTSSTQFTVTVNPPNTPPTITSIADQTVEANTPTGALAFTVGDAQTAASALTVTASSSNAALIPVGNIVFGGSGASRTVTVTPANVQSGSSLITLTVSDGVLTTVTTFTVTVSVPNTAPTITSVSNQSIAANGSTGALAFTVGDTQTAPGSLTVTASSSNTTLVPVGNVVLGGSGANRTVTVTPAAGQVGTATITLTVSDGTLTTSTTFTVTVVAAPKVESVVFGDGTVQRSMVKTIVVTFDKTVILDAGAFLLQRRVGSALTPFSAAELTINVASTTVSGKTVATLTFSGSLIVGGSLSDGNWQLTVASNKVHAGGADLDGDANGTAGGDYVKGAVAADNFFRLFGDTNGNRLVNAIEFNQFRQTNGLTSASPNYNARFDYQSNNVVNALDFNQFRLRNGTTLPG